MGSYLVWAVGQTLLPCSESLVPRLVFGRYEARALCGGDELYRSWSYERPSYLALYMQEQ